MQLCILGGLKNTGLRPLGIVEAEPHDIFGAKNSRMSLTSFRRRVLNETLYSSWRSSTINFGPRKLMASH